jgi:ubiquitin-like modifier-activating enzyme ATG7
MTEKKIFQYVPIKSTVNPDFWYKLAEIKLDVEKLEETNRKIYASYTNFMAKNCLIDLDTTSFNA